MTIEQLFTRTEQNISDAAFVRNKFIPTALADARWNIAVFEAFRVAGGRLLVSHTDLALKGTGRVVRQFVSKPDPNRVVRLKDALQNLRSSRESAFFGTIQYSEHQARESGRLLNAALESAKAFVVQ